MTVYIRFYIKPRPHIRRTPGTARMISTQEQYALDSGSQSLGIVPANDARHQVCVAASHSSSSSPPPPPRVCSHKRVIDTGKIPTPQFLCCVPPSLLQHISSHEKPTKQRKTGESFYAVAIIPAEGCTHGRTEQDAAGTGATETGETCRAQSSWGAAQCAHGDLATAARDDLQRPETQGRRQDYGEGMDIVRALFLERSGTFSR